MTYESDCFDPPGNNIYSQCYRMGMAAERATGVLGDIQSVVLICSRSWHALSIPSKVIPSHVNEWLVSRLSQQRSKSECITPLGASEVEVQSFHLQGL
jgi:hypothetical protein